MRKLALLLIRGYQLIVSPWLGANCRYYPSCSQYTAEAVDRYGAHPFAVGPLPKAILGM